ncbi:ABC transporter permease [Streptomyces sp. NBC_00669]|uniref:ABC transporter permease n=1 Tax=unclassified Streptomyces TaxID=2593676 RepID=UPI002E24747C|nr:MULTISPECIES: ABC transporter permease [unclassified Streptomyces]
MSDVSQLTAEAAAPDQPKRAVARLRVANYRDLSLIPVIFIVGVVGFIVSPTFLTSDNLIGVLQQCSELSLLVLGEAMILILGRMDLSLESTIGVAPVIAMWLVMPRTGSATYHGIGLLPGWTSIPICLLVGVVVGGFNGFMILKLRVNGFIATLGMLTMLRGLQVGISQGKSIVEVPKSFSYLGGASWLGAPAAIWICLVLFVAGGLALGYLRHGRALYAIGGNKEAARAAGIRVDLITWSVLAIASLLAAFAGILYVGHYGAISSTQGQNWIFQVFAATVIGGISLNGGRGTLFGALTGVVALQLVVNVMTLGGVPPLWNQFLYGAIIIVALIISRFASGEQED